MPDPEPGPDEVVVEVARAGMNFADTHQRENDYLAKAEVPLIPGGEISGRTPDGRRVAAMLANGGYAEKVAVPRAALVPIPDEVSDDQAAGVLLQGLTAWTLLRISGRVETGESVVVQAAGGGTGTLAVQLAKRIGAGRVIALASSPEKRELAERLGADVAVDSRSEHSLRRSSRPTAVSRSTSSWRCREVRRSTPASRSSPPSDGWSASASPRANRTRSCRRS